MKPGAHARLQILIRDHWLRENTGELGRRLCQGNGIPHASGETLLTPDHVAMHMASAAIAVLEAVSDAADVSTEHTP